MGSGTHGHALLDIAPDTAQNISQQRRVTRSALVDRLVELADRHLDTRGQQAEQTSAWVPSSSQEQRACKHSHEHKQARTPLILQVKVLDDRQEAALSLFVLNAPKALQPH